ncbi:SCO7613 C-terminal domain-containing membrane protein [Streptomyces sp. NPDC020490]|uniref:SCO7613 C-terminal domain-containing membrane protein n=1 Tax=Streptomyces sp. NPDC020490 TaxID=3365078 RepID=UPI0037BBDA9C
MTHLPPPAEELRLIDAELWQLDARRAQLLARRAWLVAALRPAAPTAPAPGARSEAGAPRVQNVLLLLGGVLLVIAAMAFTLVSWGHLGIAGRAAVLGAVTLAALAAPAPLVKRGLRSTAESVAGLALALTVLDAYALHETALTGTDATGYAAAASAVLAVLWAAYGLLPGTAALRLPGPAALVAAQVTLVLWAIAAAAGPYGVTAALLVTAGFDTALALRATGRAVRLTAVCGAYGVGGWGVAGALWLSWSAAGPGAATRAAALLVLAAAIALASSWRLVKPLLATGNALVGGLLLVAALGGTLRVTLPDDWTVPAHLVWGVALLAAVRAPLPEPVRRGLAGASAAVQGLALLWALPVVAVTLLGPVSWAGRVWSGAPADARAAVTADLPWPSHAVAAPVVLAVVAAVAASVSVACDAAWRPRALAGALTLVWTTALVLPAVLQVPYTAGLLLQGLLAAAVLAVAALTSARHTATVLALVTSAGLALLSLAGRTPTLTVLSLLAALFAAAACVSRLAPVAAPAALAYAAAVTCATGAAAGWQPQHTALLVLAVPAAAALFATGLGGSRATVPIEVAGAAAGLLAIGLAACDAPMLALVLALCGVITAGTALRPGRRHAGYAATVLFVLAGWVRLAAWDVTAPEAYSLPVTVPALVVGVLRRQRDPRTSSWTAYGPGLAVTLLPSLAAAWADPHVTRPLLLGTGALLVTLAGARQRLQAPLLLGGSVLVLDALHELAPYVVQVTDALPRWVPPALAGLLLLALGATYESRLRDVRRVREVLGRLS